MISSPESCLPKAAFRFISVVVATSSFLRHNSGPTAAGSWIVAIVASKVLLMVMMASLLARIRKLIVAGVAGPMGRCRSTGDSFPSVRGHLWARYILAMVPWPWSFSSADDHRLISVAAKAHLE